MEKVSEKLLEKKLIKAVKDVGGIPLKLECNYFAGLPDRLILLPTGKALFAEIKTTGKSPSPIQREVIKKLTGINHEVWLVDSSEALHAFTLRIQDLTK